MEWKFDYDVIIANGDGESGEWTVELAAEDAELLLDAIIDGNDLEEFFEDEGITDRVYGEVLSDVGSELLESADLYDEGEEDAAYIIDEGCDIEITPQSADFTDDGLIEELICRAVERSRQEGTGIIHDVIERFGRLYSDDPEEYALGCAVNFRAHAYLLECRRKEREDNVFEAADAGQEAVPESANEDRYLRCRFAVRGDNWKILAFTKSFQEEVFQTLLDENGLEREDVIAFLDGSGEEPEYRGDLKRTLRAIGVYPYNSDAAFENMIGEDGAEAAELIDWLGIATSTAHISDYDIYYID